MEFRSLYPILFRILRRFIISFDMALAFFLLLVWLFFIVLPLSLIAFCKNSQRKIKNYRKVIFLSYEGYNVAPARVRCYHFSEGVQKFGLETEVYAYWENFRRLSSLPFPFKRIWETEKILMNIVSFFKLLNKGRCIIYEQRPNYDFLVPLFLKWVNGSKLIMDIDDWIFDYHVFSCVKVKQLLPLFGRYCDTCIVSSHYLKTYLAKHFKNVILIPTYVDADKFRPDKNNGHNATLVLSWIGTIFQEFTFNNVMFVIESFNQACTKLRNSYQISLDIVGGGDFFSKLEETIQQNFSHLNINLRGWLPPDEIPDYLRSTGVGLYSLLDDSDFHKSKSPTKIYEYLACGKPVISTSLGEAKYTLEHGVTGFLAKDIDEFANCIVRLSKDDILRRKMGLTGRKRVLESFNQFEACSNLKNAINDVFA